MARARPNPLYYSKNGVMSYHAFLSFIMSARGNGKTFAFKDYALDAPFETVWVRRYEPDLPGLMKKFMDDLYKAGLYLDDEIKIDGNTLKINGENKIYFVALSTAHKQKSVAFPNVDMIVFDEFIETRKNKKYLPEEATIFLDLVETVNRLRVDRPEVRCFLLANKISFVNPYFKMFGIKPFTERFKTYKNGLIVVENYNNEVFKKAKEKSRFGQLVAGTKYGDYAIGNELWRDTDAFIKKRPKDTFLRFNVRYEGTTFGIWQNGDGIYCAKAHNDSAQTFATREDLQEGELVLKSTDVPISWFKALHENNHIWFEDTTIKYTVYALMEDVCK